MKCASVAGCRIRCQHVTRGTRAGVLDVLDLAGGSGYPAIPLAKELPEARITLTGVRCCFRCETCRRS